MRNDTFNVPNFLYTNNQRLSEGTSMTRQWGVYS